MMLLLVLDFFPCLDFKHLDPRPTHLSLRGAPILFPRPQNRTRRETDVSHPLSRFHARPCPQAELSKDQL